MAADKAVEKLSIGQGRFFTQQCSTPQLLDQVAHRAGCHREPQRLWFPSTGELCITFVFICDFAKIEKSFLRSFYAHVTYFDGSSSSRCS